MRNLKVRVCAVFLVFMLVGSVFSGCSKKETASNETKQTGETKPAGEAGQSPEVPKGSGKISEKPITISYWVGMDASTAAVVKSFGEVEMFRELEKKTNVTLQFQSPPVGQEKEQFNLLIASRDLPDIIETGWLGYPGGPEKAIDDGIIIKLNELIDKNAPSLKKILQANPSVNKQARTDSGTLYAFPAIGIGKYKTTTGPMVRKDWLDELGLSAPETLDEWTNMLRQFKDKKGAEVPLTGDTGLFASQNVYSGMFMVSNGFFQENGKVKYGPVEPAYRKYLEQLRSWFKEGLLDQDFVANNSKAIDAKITSGKAGVVNGGIGGAMGTYLNTMKGKDPKFDLIAVQYPVLKKGDEPVFISRAWEVRTTGCAALTSSNKYPAESAKWLDFLYSEEGNLMKNFGLEGLTYKMEGGYPKYTDLIMKNPDGLSVAQAMAKYFRANTPSPGLIDERYHEQYFQLPQQKDASKLWARYTDNALKVELPPVTATQQESQELSTIMSSIQSYQQESFVKFVMGQEPLENFDRFVEQIKKMKIERTIEIYQGALERYNKR